MKQISDLMDEKFIASEGRMRAEIVASEARTGEKIDRVENNLSAEIKKNRISMTRHMQELNTKWVETNEKLDRMLARMDGMDKNMSAMRAEMDAVPKRFDAVETNLGRKISESEAATRRYTEKLFFQVAEGKKKRSSNPRSVLRATVRLYLSNSDSKIRRNIRVSGGSFILPAQMNVQNVSFCLLPPGKTVFPYISG